MRTKTELKSIPNSLNRLLTIRIVLFSSLVTVFVTLFQLYNDYRSDFDQILNQQNEIVTSYLKPLESNLWIMDETTIESQVYGISSLQHISFVNVTSNIGGNWTAGTREKDFVIEKKLDLTHAHINDERIKIGELIIQSDLTQVYKRLLDKTLVILLSNGFKTFIVAGFIMFLIRRMITTPLYLLVKHFESMNLEQSDKPLMLSRNKSYRGDEIERVIMAVNKMSSTLHFSYLQLKNSEDELKEALKDREKLLELEKQFKQELELKVKERTIELEAAIEELKFAQDTLIRTEKMASLGGLVAGLCHEINTPLGICVTVASTLVDSTKTIKDQFNMGELTKSSLDKFIQSNEKADILLSKNLARAVELMGHFKQVAVDQTSSQRRNFELGELIEEVIIVTEPLIKNPKIKVQFDCLKKIEMNSFPGSINQIVTNLINNSIRHAYSAEDEGKIQIRIKESSNSEQVTITYADDGKGIPPDNLKKIFDPFFTTGSRTVDTGLGLNIVYNIVNLTLGGTIQVKNNTPAKGCCFTIEIPKTAPEQNSPAKY
ncbi:ATP-binding protein [Aliikangiella maris]|uniref:ATP-binding protein n=2 Tax=Aliikangiella maris TaxID=3162458 RepID=A0ABV2BQD6_9GAMM